MKMKVTDFAAYLEAFFTEYLASEVNASKHTIRSNRDTFVFLIDYMHNIYGLRINRLVMDDLNRSVILAFLIGWKTQGVTA